MKKLALLTLILVSNLAIAQPIKLSKDNIREVIAAMTLEEKATLVTGASRYGNGNAPVVGQSSVLVQGAAGTSYAFDRLGIPAFVMADGPAGLRISPTINDQTNTFYCTGFPVATVMASSWNTTLVEQVGKAVGQEVKEYGVDILLAPAINLHRSPLCGRNFEYYSEDPVVTGKIAAAMINGVESNNVGTSLKHFAFNNQETNRNNVNAIISPRAARELYLKGFEIAVKESQPWTIMSSYNRINGSHTSESRDLITTILRNEWGFEGMVMTDWNGGKDASAMMKAGNDLLMPGNPAQSQAIINVVKAGTLDESYLDACVYRVLEIVTKSLRFNGTSYSNKPDLNAHAQVARNAATEGMILLKNDNDALPLAKAKLALFGVGSYDFIAGGTGSGDVNKAYVVSPVEGLANNGFTINEKLKNAYTKDLEAQKAKNQASGKRYQLLGGGFRPSERIVAKNEISAAARNSSAAIITISRQAGEGADRKAIEGDFYLTASEKALINDVTAAFKAKGKKSIVVLNIGGPVETFSWKEVPDAILLAWQCGQEGGNAISDILCGAISPSGKLTSTFPIDIMDIGASANFPNNYIASREARTEPLKDVDYVTYAEDIFVGYRFFDKFEKSVSYPFGYGLSYTTFKYSNAKVSKEGFKYLVTVDVKNVGKAAGKEVVQAYVSAPESITMNKPVKELKAFAKTNTLQPGQSQTITMQFDSYDIASYDEDRVAWVTDSGDYKLLIAASSDDIQCQLTFRVPAEITYPTHKVLLQQ